MRNLLGRLNARTTEELTRIAAAWQVPLPAGDRLGMVSRLYRALTDPRTVRDCWDHLPDDERAMVRLLAVSEETALTLPELASHLVVSAVRLYLKAIVAREGDDEPLPIGVLPRLFLPRELTQLFRRVQDEIDAGDVSATPLRALLALLDDRELEETAETWGVRVVPGLRAREDLTRQILHQVDDSGRIAAVAAKRRRDAALIWRRLRESPDGAPVPLAAAAEAAGLTKGEARHAQRLREALAELESALLVWHTYRPDGSRWLFIPAEIRAPRPSSAADFPALTPALAPPAVPPPWRPSYALAWDVLTLLRALTLPDAPQVHAASDLPRSWRRRLNLGLWHRGSDLPPTGYVEFLAALAQAEGLLHGGEPAGDLLTVSPAIRLWRDRSFADQMSRLLWWWLASKTWIEGHAREDVDVWGAEWAPFRRKLLVRLAALDPDAWYPLDELAQWSAARDPEMLGATLTVATARHVEPAGLGDAGRRRAAVAEVATVTIETAFQWFGLVEIGDAGGGARLVRMTEAGRATAGANPLPAADDLTTAAPSLTIDAQGRIELRLPSPLRVWSLSAFADGERLDRIAIYRLTEDSVKRALASGFELHQIVTFLRAQSGTDIPDEIETRLRTWTRAFRRVRLRPALVATPDDPALLEELRAVATVEGLAVRVIGDALLIVLPSADGDGDDAGLADILRDAGFAPLWDTRPPSGRPLSPQSAREAESTERGTIRDRSRA
jgi:hypothetical protein